MGKKNKTKNTTIYHYCNTDVFIKIMQSKTIRLSDITKSNDSMEISWINGFLRDQFIQKYNDEKTKYFKNNFSIDAFKEYFDKHYDLLLSNDNYNRLYLVSCFSENGDLLSQWRGYADDANGFSIGFDIDSLCEQAKREIGDDIRIDKIIYTLKDQKNIVIKSAKDLIKSLKKIIKPTKSNVKNDKKYESENIASINTVREKEYDSCFIKCFENICHLAVITKNPFFAEEKEYRINYLLKFNQELGITNESKNSSLSTFDIKYYNRYNDIIPYFDLPFKNDSIKEVIIGPKCKATVNDVKLFLNKNGIDCNVIKSKGTYR